MNTSLHKRYQTFCQCCHWKTDWQTKLFCFIVLKKVSWWLHVLVCNQAIKSGLEIICNMDEVQFVQNLVYFVERTYRTPDFGMWGRSAHFHFHKIIWEFSKIYPKIKRLNFFQRHSCKQRNQWNICQFNRYGQSCSRIDEWFQLVWESGRMYAQFIVITGMATDAVLFEVLCSEDFIEDFIVQNKLM